MGDVLHCSGPPNSEMTYTVSSGTLNSTIPYHTAHSYWKQGMLGATGVRHVWAGAGSQRAACRGGGITCGLTHSLLQFITVQIIPSQKTTPDSTIREAQY